MSRVALVVLVLLAGCTALSPTASDDEEPPPAWKTHPQCSHEYDDAGRTIAAWCPVST